MNVHFPGTIRDRSGFNNRLNGILALWRYCDMAAEDGIDATFSITWPITNLVPGKYTDILLNPMKVREAPSKYMVGWSLWVPGDNMAIMDYSIIQKTPKLVAHKDYENIPKNMIEAFLPYYDRVQLHPAVVTKCRETKLLPGTVGVHCRESKDWAQAGRSLRGIGLYCNEIDKLDKETPLFISTHLPEHAEQFKRRFGSRVTVQVDKDYSSQTPNQLQNSVVDLMVLSKCDRLIGDHASSFLAGAWWFGGCKAQVTRIKRTM